jgi:hypothetical protein
MKERRMAGRQIRCARAAAALALCAMSLAHVGARADEVTGSILVSTGTPVSDGNSRPERCAYQLDPIGGQGVFGWVIEGVTPNHLFTLKAGSTATDVDIDFFRALTPCSSDPDKTTPEHDNRTGNETGVVPPHSTVAIVTLRNGPPGATFTYSD